MRISSRAATSLIFLPVQITTINVSVCVESKGKSWVGECERVRQRMSEDKETRSAAALKRKSGVVV